MAYRVTSAVLTAGVKAGKKHGLVLGSGSNVIDAFFTVRKLPLPGEKTYFSHEKFQTDTLVGGVTLNHLTWARLLGCPTGLMALQGNDATGKQIRATMQQLGVSTDYVRVSDAYTTSVSHVLIDEGTGERTILMAPASTSKLTREAMEKEFAEAVAGASMITTEISQLPLSGVDYLLEAARKHQIPSLLDVDVTPTIATTAARLGTLDELRKCLPKASVLKLTASAAEELLQLVSSEKLAGSTPDIASQLCRVFGSRLCVVTDGSRGSALAMATKESGFPAVHVPIYDGVVQKDATGAGDAFFGGLVASLHKWGYPVDAAQMNRVGKVAAAAGAACVEVLGALPIPAKSSQRLEQLNKDCGALLAGLPLPRQVRDTPLTSPDQMVQGAVSASLSSDQAALEGLTMQSHDTLEQQAYGTIVDHLKICSTKGGHIYTSGIGKSAAVANRLAVSLRSISLPASFIHASEFPHGDFGSARAGDSAILFSNSGRTPELLDVCQRLKERGVTTVSITKNRSTALAASCHFHLQAPAEREILGSIPSRSIVVQEAVVNALLAGLVQATGFTQANFLVNHPGGTIGAKQVPHR